MAWIWPIHVWSLRTFTPPVNQPLWLKHVKTLTKIYITSLTNTFTWQSTTDQFRQHYYQHLCIILIIFWQCWSTTPPDSWSRLSRWSWPWWRTRPSRARCASCAGSSRSSSRCSCTWRPSSITSYVSGANFFIRYLKTFLVSQLSLWKVSLFHDDISLIIFVVTYQPL